MMERSCTQRLCHCCSMHAVSPVLVAMLLLPVVTASLQQLLVLRVWCVCERERERKLDI